MQDIINIAALTIVAIFIYMIIMGHILKYKKKIGKMNPRGLIEWTSIEMSSELQQHGYFECGLETLKAIDSYIEKKRKVYNSASMLKDKDFILRCGSLAGQVIRYKKHWKWKFTEDKIPYLEKKGKIIYPFEIIKQRINGDIESLYGYFENIDKRSYTQ